MKKVIVCAHLSRRANRATKVRALLRYAHPHGGNAAERVKQVRPMAAALKRRRSGGRAALPSATLVAGLPVTRPERTIIDAIATGTQPGQVQMAIRQALERGLTTPRRLRTAASQTSARARKLIEHTLEEVK